ncbi:23S rRNA (uracil(1939)-C(5))-methyltransferase RlmD [Bengtsoniella intestinalis]|uniref:23S rRNA (uracil(1939)-C(5))-methyltransferase RlmD n=1 Tax=Bengtsoniella intestinalis TaxID=3073143 RepID=UPI00391F4BF3
MEKLIQNNIYRGTVHGYSSEGHGIVRIDGAVVFVSGALDGEDIDLRITKVMKTMAAAEVVTVHSPSAHRVTPQCPHFGYCGGCAMQHMDYAEECSAKGQRVQDALTRLGGLDIQVNELIGAKEPWHYRNKSQHPVSPQGDIGFYQQRTHRVIPIERCLIQSAVSDAVAKAVKQWMSTYKVDGYNERTGKGMIRHVYTRVNQKGECLCCVVANGRKLLKEPELIALIQAAAPSVVGIVLNTNKEDTNVVLGRRYRTLWGQDFLMDSLCGLEFKLSVPSFYQVNRDQAEVLYGKAIELAGLTGTETVLDLYCGTGTITLCLAKHAKHVIGAEIVEAAIADAQENAVRNGVENVEFVCGDASEIAQKFQADGLKPDVITVDPPRKGLAPEVIDAIVQMAPEKVVYVSCDPATLGRDVKRFAEQGYTATQVTAVDMFPRTHHVETVILLSQQKCEMIINNDSN